MRLEAIQPGDIVDVVAPASACTKEELKLGIRALHALGLVPRVPKDIFAKSLLFSNSDDKRLAQFKKAIYARDSRFIWCVRGGYGAIRLMPEIAKWKRPAHSKILLGYSDITTLHVYLNQKWKWPTLHGPLLDRLGRNALTPSEAKELFGLLYGGQSEVVFKNLKPLNKAARQKKSLRAPVLGGNMTVLQSGLGTPSSLRPRGDIIFFEDTGERPHRVDRMLAQFAQAGWFDGARAILLGQFMLNNPKDRRGLWNDVFPRFAAEMKIPVLAGMPVGHDPRAQRTLPFNTPAVLKLGVSPTLTVDSGIRAK
ncbi:MAG: S66 peptidase family protein [Bdellovibrionales bacterium]